MFKLNQIILYAINVESLAGLFSRCNYTWMMRMNPLMLMKVRKSLILHEGIRKFPYEDSVGKITIGVGYNLSDRGMTDEWIDTQLAQDIDYFYSELSKFAWFETLNNDRQVVLIDMAFMGMKNFKEFKKMIDALDRHDFVAAAREMLDSAWTEQVKGRAIQLARAMESGVYNV